MLYSYSKKYIYIILFEKSERNKDIGLINGIYSTSSSTVVKAFE